VTNLTELQKENGLQKEAVHVEIRENYPAEEIEDLLDKPIEFSKSRSEDFGFGRLNLAAGPPPSYAASILWK
jgi:hypothetical protein